MPATSEFRHVPPKRTLIGFFIAVMVMGCTVAGLSIWYDRELTRRQTLAQVRSTAVLVEERASGIIQAVDQLALRVAAFVGARMPDLIGSEADWAELKGMVASLPYAVSMSLTDAQGIVRLSTLAFPVLPASVKDREYFAEHAAGADFHIGTTIFGRFTLRPVFSVSRRLEDGGGRFTGVVLVTLDPVHLERVVAESGLGPSSVIGILRENGSPILIHPAQDQGAPLSSTGLSASAGMPSNAEETVLLDRSELAEGRVAAVRRFDAYPLVAVVEAASADAFASWRVRSTWTVALALLGLAAAAAFLSSALRGLRMEKRARDDLEAGNRALDDSNRRLAQALDEKGILFREMHHRVNNNLQIVSSLLNLQIRNTERPEVRTALGAALRRIESMSLLHRILCRTDEAGEIDLGTYLKELCGNLVQAYGTAERGVELAVEAVPCSTRLDRAMPVALAVNEAITNSLKHAFPDGRHGKVAVSLSRGPGGTVVEVRDDGVGMPVPPKAGQGVGTMLLRALVRQAGATFRLESGDGTVFRLALPPD